MLCWLLLQNVSRIQATLCPASWNPATPTSPLDSQDDLCLVSLLESCSAVSALPGAGQIMPVLSVGPANAPTSHERLKPSRWPTGRACCSLTPVAPLLPLCPLSLPSAAAPKPDVLPPQDSVAAGPLRSVSTLPHLCQVFAQRPAPH